MRDDGGPDCFPNKPFKFTICCFKFVSRLLKPDWRLPATVRRGSILAASSLEVADLLLEARLFAEPKSRMAAWRSGKDVRRGYSDIWQFRLKRNETLRSS